MRVLSAIVVLLATAACSKPVDPSYLSEIERAAESVCTCVTLPADQRVACHGAAKSVYPTVTPTGEPPGIYEEKLDEASKADLAQIRGRASSCETKLLAP